VAKLRNTCCKSSSGGGGKVFDWVMLGRESGICFNSVPDRVRFLAGPMEAEREAKERKVAHRQKRTDMSNVEEVRPEQVTKEKGTSDQASAVEKSMKEMKDKLTERVIAESNENDCDDIDGVQFLFNPKSFTQTVENMFYYSFLVKKGEAEIGVRSRIEGDGNKRLGLYAAPIPKLDDKLPARQAVISFTMRDWRNLCEAHNVKEGDMGDRKTMQQKRAKKAGRASSQESADE